MKELDFGQSILLFFFFFQKTFLKTKKIADNEIGDDGAEYFAEALKKNSNLTSITLSFDKSSLFMFGNHFINSSSGKNLIGEKGVKSIFQALKTNKSLKKLDLCFPFSISILCPIRIIIPFH